MYCIKKVRLQLQRYFKVSSPYSKYFCMCCARLELRIADFGVPLHTV